MSIVRAAYWSALVVGVLALVACKAGPEANPSASPVSANEGKDAAYLVQRQVEAYNAQDLEAFLATYAEDAVITSRSTGQIVLQGKQAMRERYGKMFQQYPRNRVRIAERRVEGKNVVVDHEIISGRAPEKPDPWDVGWVRYEVDGDLIRRVELP
jgi:uncharacterized protein (TIGR02246 family)